MIAKDFERFLLLPEQDRRDVFEQVAETKDTVASYIEKDFWVCVVLDVLFNGLPHGHPDLLFKGGTALSKCSSLISRFSEDIDIVVSREWLGFDGDRDPTGKSDLSGRARTALFDELKGACSEYVLGDLAKAVGSHIGNVCRIAPDDDDQDGQTLLIEYPSIFGGENDYVRPRVKLEAGARSARDPHEMMSVSPYIAEALTDGWSFVVDNVRTIRPERTYLEKVLILHGQHCGFRDEGEKRLPADANRLSRHYYDVAMMTDGEVGKAALADKELLESVCGHNQLAFKQAWKKFEEAVPGGVRIVPQPELRRVLERDYDAMKGMVLGEAPSFDWIMEQLRSAEDKINEQ